LQNGPPAKEISHSKTTPFLAFGLELQPQNDAKWVEIQGKKPLTKWGCAQKCDFSHEDGLTKNGFNF
jgi:hypothetical protein